MHDSEPDGSAIAAGGGLNQKLCDCSELVLDNIPQGEVIQFSQLSAVPAEGRRQASCIATTSARNSAPDLCRAESRRTTLAFSQHAFLITTPMGRILSPLRYASSMI